MGNLSWKIGLVFYLNNTEGGKARSSIKMVTCQDKDNKSCSFWETKWSSACTTHSGKELFMPLCTTRSYSCNFILAFTKLCFLIKPEDIKISTVTFVQVEFFSLMYFHGEESVSRERMNDQIQERPDLPRFPFCHQVIGLEGSLGLI